MILAGDIGGTNTRLALFNGNLRVPERLCVYQSAEYTGLDQMLELFLAGRHVALEAASFGVAAPVRAGYANGVNFPWAVDGRELASLLGLRSVGLINDLEANAHGIAVLGDDDIVVLSEGAADASGNAALISAGTGLGQAGLYWDGERYRPFATEGGHADFAPRDEVQAALLLYMRKKHGHVSFERICSGSGLVDVHAFFCDFTGEPPEEWLADELDTPGAAAAICRAALDYRSTTCVRAVRLFVSVYGAQAANLALAVGAMGGVYVGGGIAPKVLRFLQHGGFMTAFLDKGRFAALLARIPVRVILNEQAALLGAARYAVSGGVP